MPYTVHIRDNVTGEVRDYHDDSPLTYDAGGPEPDQMWIWKEGNYACDCNRALFFLRAVGADDDGDDTPCNVLEPGRYSIETITLDNGKSVSIDRSLDNAVGRTKFPQAQQTPRQEAILTRCKAGERNLAQDG